jgi:LacI family repressor for deo operon, udp, cdd, tsx, nupC, and nupG
MSTPATQTALAKKLGLSRSTVAAALNPNSPVRLREATIKLVREEAARLNYRPNQYAQIMRRGRSGIVGIFHFGGLSQVAAQRAWHASQAIQSGGYKVLSTEVSWSPGGAKAGCEAMLDAQVEGIIVAGLNDPESEQELAALQKSGIPIVTLSGNELPGAPHVRGDASDAMYRMTQHLIGLGRRKLLLLASFSGSYNWAGAERLKGFESAIGTPLVDHFPRTRPSQPIGRVIKSDFPEQRFDPFHAAKAAMHQLLATSPLPDAVLCGNDDWAVGALAACREAGIAVPGQLAITGYDNTATGAYLDVPLTTISQPSEAMALKAVDLLMKLMSGQKLSASSRLIKLPCELVVRQSCGSPAR